MVWWIEEVFGGEEEGRARERRERERRREKVRKEQEGEIENKMNKVCKIYMLFLYVNESMNKITIDWSDQSLTRYQKAKF